MRDGEFNDPRLVAVYDAEFPWSRPEGFFLSVVNETAAARVLDLGCGTGRLTLAMAAAGHRVTGVDPARVSLDAARAKPGAERVTWLQGSTEVLPERAFDTAIMSGHVAQFLVDDATWLRALRDLRRSLVLGGRLVFDSRDPAGRAWERWNPTDSRHRVRLPDGVEIEVWNEVTAVEDGVVSFARHYVFPATELLSTGRLRFRTETELRTALRAAGFAVERIHGGWDRQPVGEGDGEFLVVAH